MSGMLTRIFFVLFALTGLTDSLRADCVYRAGAKIVASFYEGESIDEYLFSKKPLSVSYCEYFYVKTDHEKLVRYWYDDKLIAEKHLDYSISSSMPLSRQIDFRNNELRQFKKVGENFFALYRKPGEKLSRRLIATKDRLVNDAGFNHVIQEHWEALLNGQRITFQFLSLVHRRSLALTASLASNDMLGDANDRYVGLVVRPSNPWLNFLGDPIFLAYTRDNRQLSFYSGTVNLLSKTNKVQSGLLVYRYFPETARPVENPKVTFLNHQAP